MEDEMWKELLERESKISKHRRQAQELETSQVEELMHVDFKRISDMIKIPGFDSEAIKFSLILRWCSGQLVVDQAKLSNLLEAVDLSAVYEEDKNFLSQKSQEPPLSENNDFLNMYIRILRSKDEQKTSTRNRGLKHKSSSSSHSSIIVKSFPEAATAPSRGSRPSPKSRTAAGTSSVTTQAAGAGDLLPRFHGLTSSLSISKRKLPVRSKQKPLCYESDDSEDSMSVTTDDDLEKTCSPTRSQVSARKRNSSRIGNDESPKKHPTRLAECSPSGQSTCIIYPRPENQSRFLWSYNWEKKTSEKLYKVEVPRDFSCYIAAGNNIYDMGGAEAKKKPQFGDDSEGSEVVEVFGIAGNRFRRRGPALLEPRKEFSACVIDENIYVTGGCFKMTALNHCEMLNWTVEGSVWTEMAHNLNIPRGAHAISSIKKKLFVVGGIGGKLESTVEMFDTERDNAGWLKMAAMPKSRGRLNAAVIDDKLYALGGEDKEERPLKIVECYNAETDIWEKIPPMRTPRRDSGVLVKNGAIYVFGGNDGINAYSEFYDPRVGKWENNPWDPVLHVDGKFNNLVIMIY